jgi:hypothetical protein
MVREAAELVVHEGHEPVQCPFVTAVPRQQQLGNSG